jgi:hypothetical protein
MTTISDTQEFARHFNEDEAIWQRFQKKRLARRLPGSDSPLPESVLDHLDWLDAEREIRITRAVAKRSAFAPGQ